MKINDFASEITKLEGLKKNLTVADVKEVLRLIDKKLCGEVYKMIKKIK